MASSWPEPTQIFEHYLRSLEAISHLKQSLVETPLKIGPKSRFLTKTPEEVEQAFREMSLELEIQINLLLIASGEARLRVDFNERVEQRRKDNVSKRFRLLKKQQNARRNKGVRLDDLLKIWAEEQAGRTTPVPISLMGQLLRYRHWVAHGRYWVDKSGLRNPDPFDVWRILSQFFNCLPGLESLPPFDRESSSPPG